MKRTGIARFNGIRNGYDDHQFIKLSKNPKKGFASYVTYQLAWKYMPDRRKSINKWKKEKQTCHLLYENKTTGEKLRSKPISYLIFSKYIRANDFFDYKEFNLPLWNSLWLDDSFHSFFNCQLDKNNNYFKFNNSIPQQQYGESYPIKPSIDREGHMFTSIQSQLTERIIRKRTELVSSSKGLSEDWVFDLRELINSTISLLEITLNQVYIKAKYDPLPHWKFDLNALGKKEGRRLKDKLKWVTIISGKNLNIESERLALDSLREVRNHLNHFDPPSLVITLEEAADWLNYIMDIGMILCKIRIALDIQLSISLLNFLLQKEAVFNPIDLGFSRSKLISEQYGYKSSVWKKPD
jgi:hypothetical protein